MTRDQAWAILCGEPVTFSPNCRSGLLTVCDCKRCRTSRGEPVTAETEAKAATAAAEADRKQARAERRSRCESQRWRRRNAKKDGRSDV